MRKFYRFLFLAAFLFFSATSASAQNNFNGQSISLDLRQTNILSVFRIISEVSGLNVVVSDEINGKINLKLNDVPWDQVLDIILRQNNLYQVTEGNVMIIVPIDKAQTLYN